MSPLYAETSIPLRVSTFFASVVVSGAVVSAAFVSEDFFCSGLSEQEPSESSKTAVIINAIAFFIISRPD